MNTITTRSPPIVLQLESSADSAHIAGKITAMGQQRSFTGWMGLMAAIDALRAQEANPLPVEQTRNDDDPRPWHTRDPQ